MSSLRLTFCTGAVVAGVLTPVAYPLVPAAYAGDSAAVVISVTPSPPAPGSDIRLRVEGCERDRGTAASKAFVADAVLTGGDGALVGETRVRSSLAPGRYRVEVTCDGRRDELRGTIEVARKAGRVPPSGHASAPSSGHSAEARPPGPPASPVAPVRAGGGGTAHLASAEARDDGPGVPHAVVGLVLAGVTAVVVLVRGARRGRGTE